MQNVPRLAPLKTIKARRVSVTGSPEGWNATWGQRMKTIHPKAGKDLWFWILIRGNIKYRAGVNTARRSRQAWRKQRPNQRRHWEGWESSGGGGDEEGVRTGRGLRLHTTWPITYVLPTPVKWWTLSLSLRWGRTSTEHFHPCGFYCSSGASSRLRDHRFPLQVNSDITGREEEDLEPSAAIKISRGEAFHARENTQRMDFIFMKFVCRRKGIKLINCIRLILHTARCGNFLSLLMMLLSSIRTILHRGFKRNLVKTFKNSGEFLHVQVKLKGLWRRWMQSSSSYNHVCKLWWKKAEEKQHLKNSLCFG